MQNKMDNDGMMSPLINLNYAFVRFTILVQTEITQKLLDTLPRNFDQTFMLPRR